MARLAAGRALEGVHVDATDLVEGTRGLDPTETLVIVSSKTFTTIETLTNAHTARDWLVAGTGDEGVVALQEWVAHGRGVRGHLSALFDHGPVWLPRSAATR